MKLDEKRNPEEVVGKDRDRIQGMLDKAGGDEAKLLRLAKQMAKSITDVDKAMRRGKAAEAKGLTPVANAFYARAIELGKKVIPESVGQKLDQLLADMRLVEGVEELGKLLQITCGACDSAITSRRMGRAPFDTGLPPDLEKSLRLLGWAYGNGDFFCPLHYDLASKKAYGEGADPRERLKARFLQQLKDKVKSIESGVLKKRLQDMIADMEADKPVSQHAVANTLELAGMTSLAAQIRKLAGPDPMAAYGDVLKEK